MMSSSYSQWNDESPNICHVRTAPRTQVIAQIFDLRGRLINAASGCAFELKFIQLEKNNATLFSHCGFLIWDYQNVTVDAGNEPMQLNITFKKKHIRGEGRVWFQLEG